VKISKTATGFDVVGLKVEGLTDGKTYTVRLLLSEAEFKHLVTLGAELLLSAPECAFIQG
jgi:hypothetical protein